MTGRWTVDSTPRTTPSVRVCACLQNGFAKTSSADAWVRVNLYPLTVIAYEVCSCFRAATETAISCEHQVESGDGYSLGSTSANATASASGSLIVSSLWKRIGLVIYVGVRRVGELAGRLGSRNHDRCHAEGPGKSRDHHGDWAEGNERRCDRDRSRDLYLCLRSLGRRVLHGSCLHAHPVLVGPRSPLVSCALRRRLCRPRSIEMSLC